MKKDRDHLKLIKNKNSPSTLKKISRFLIKLVVVVLLFMLLKYGESFFRINHITVDGPAAIDRTAEIVAAAGIEKGASIFLISEEKVATSVQLEFPFLKEVTVSRALPDQVNIHVAERMLAAFVESDGGYWSLDGDAHVFSYTNEYNSEYPLVRGLGGEMVLPDSPLNCPHRKDLLQSFFAIWPGETGLEAATIDLTDNYNLIVHTTDGLEIWFGDARNMESKVKLLQYSIPHFQDKPITHLDVRTGKRLVVSRAAVELEKEVDP